MIRPFIQIGDEVREMNDAEFQQYQLDSEAYAAYLVEQEAKATQRQTVLDRLGLTKEEASLLLGGN